MRKTVKELYAHDCKRKVQIFQRDNGSFGFEVLRYSDDPLEMSWITFGRYSECFAPSAQIAESEARFRVGWLEPQNDEG
jgi:hypothetical protein